MVKKNFGRQQGVRFGFWWLILWLFSACASKPSQPEATPTPTPQIAPVVAATPQIRTQEWAVNFGIAPAVESKQNIAFNAQGLTIGHEAPAAEMVSEKHAVTLDDAQPFLALSAEWSAVISKDAKLTVSVRASGNGSEWDEWQLSSLDGDPRTHTGLFFFPLTSRFVQYRIEMARDGRGIAPVLKSIQFRFISPGATPLEESARLHTAQQLTRAQWHCPETGFHSKQQSAAIHHLIVHHTATANDAQDWPAVVRTIWNFHAVTNGWRDVGYHYLIDPNGVIYEGRGGGDRAAGIHFSCANTGTLGIAMLGNYLTAKPPKAALQSLEQLLATKCQQFGLDPLGESFHVSTRLRLPHIAGHLDANASSSGSVCAGTYCPGETLHALLPQIRAQVRELMNTTHSAVVNGGKGY
ncbi:MAG TPA: peptidoglycan recognition family protein [Blastocatellia bacterium]|nr:peptidoglycan recognition family protein [Blastocatellia bacterium]